jgi:hypothetical protein
MLVGVDSFETYFDMIDWDDFRWSNNDIQISWDWRSWCSFARNSGRYLRVFGRGGAAGFSRLTIPYFCHSETHVTLLIHARKSTRS